MSKRRPIASSPFQKKSTAQIMTLLTYSPVPEDYKLDTYQDTCVKQLMMIVETKDFGCFKNGCRSGHFRRFLSRILAKV